MGFLKAPNILANMDQGVEAEASDGTLEQPISISMPPPPMQKAETAEKHVQLHQAERPSNGVQVSGHFERPAFAGELVDANSAQEAPGNDELRFGRSKSPLPTVLNTSSPRTMSERVVHTFRPTLYCLLIARLEWICIFVCFLPAF